MELDWIRSRKNNEKTVSWPMKWLARGTGNFLFRLFRFLILAGVSYLMIYPVLNFLTISLSDPMTLYSGNNGWLPRDPTYANFTGVLKYFKYFDHLKITLAIAGISTLLSLITCPLVGYGLARFRFRGNHLIFAMVILTIIVPVQTAQIPLYVTYQSFDFLGLGTLIGKITGEPLSVNLLNTGWVFYLPALFGMGLRSGVYIFLFRQAFMGMPKDLEDAGKVDGCSRFGIFLRIFVPNVKPVFVTEFLLSMISYWNDTTVSGMFMTLPDKAPLMIYVELITLLQNTDLTIESMEALAQQHAAILLTVAPLMILFLICQKFFIESMDRSGIKG